MKQLIVIIGPNGVGKSTTAKLLLENYEKCAYVDADWCRAINPFPFTEATKKTVIENIYCLIRNYMLCEDIDIVIFPYSFHGERAEIYETVISKLNMDGLAFEVKIVILKCSLEENIKRGKQDNRDDIRIKRGIENTFSFYDKYNYPSIDTTDLTPKQVAERVIQKICVDSAI